MEKLPILKVIDKAQDIEELYEYLKDKEFIAYDTETTGTHKNAEIIGYSVCAEETKAYYVILAYWDKKSQSLLYYNENKNISSKVLNLLATKKLIMHNALFDIDKTNVNFNINLLDALHTDTMILAHLLNENRKVGLKELGKEYFGESADEEAKVMKESIVANEGSSSKLNYELYKADAHLIGKYGAKDALLTYNLFHELVPDLYEQRLDKFFYEDESMPLLKGPTYQLNTSGIRIDMQKVLSLEMQLKAECLEAYEFIHKEIHKYVSERYKGTNKNNTFNIGAPAQLAWLCFGILNLEFSTLTKEGKNVAKFLLGKLPYSIGDKNRFFEACRDSAGQIYAPAGFKNGKKTRPKKIREPWNYLECGKNVLDKYKNHYKWIEKLLEYNKKNKLLNTYINGIKQRVEYNVLYPSFLQHGTTSGRYSSKNINFQNLPRDDKRIKSCVIPRQGKTFVGLDYSQLEPRIFAYISNDENLLKAFKSGDDFYSTIGMRVYGKFDAVPLKEGPENAFGTKYKSLRDLSKVIALATVYGATPMQLMKTTKKSKEDTQEDMNEYLTQFPGVSKLMNDSHNLAKKYGYVTNIFGRKRRMPEAKNISKIYGNLPHAQLPYEARKLLNLATNHRIQSTGASIVNRAMIAFYNNAKLAEIDCQIVTTVHDSIIVECKEYDAENVALLLQDACENTVKLETIELEALPKIGASFAEV